MISGVFRCACLLLACVSSSVSAQSISSCAAQISSFNIKSQSLVDALNEWALLTGCQQIFPTDIAVDQLPPVKAVTGRMSGIDALNRLLADTGASWTWVGRNMVAVKLLPPAHLSASHAGAARLESREEVQRVPIRAEEITVTGSRMRQEIRSDGMAFNSAPVSIFDRTTLDGLGITTVPELLRYIPQQPYGPQAEHAMHSQHAQLRGLGFDTTLLLIDGRRAVPSSTSATWNAFDLNTLPLAAIERVEVLSDSAAAVYGTDAVGGVVNIILKKAIPRPLVDVSYGTADGGAAERRVTLSAGHSAERFRASIVLDGTDREALLGSARDRWRNQNYERFGGTDQRAVTTNPANITSLTSANLPGLSSRFAVVPAGSTGIGLTSADFVGTAGQQNKDSLRRYESIVPGRQQLGVTAFADFDWTEKINLFASALYVENEAFYQSAPATGSLIVPAHNPWNPFGVAVKVDYLFDALGPIRSITESDLARVLLGVRGRRGTWEWELSGLKIESHALSWTENDVDDNKVSAALSATDPSHALNLFADGAAGSRELLTSLLAEPVRSPSSSGGTQGAAVLRGPLVAVPAGDMELVIGSEWLKSNISVNGDLPVHRDRSVGAAFAELRLPLVNQDMHIPGIQKLMLSGAGRYDDYTDFGQSFNPQLGLAWQVVRDVTLRGSMGTSFRAPSLYELFAPRTTFEGFTIPDPLRNQESTTVTLVAGGNPNLKAVEATSFTAGVDFSPENIPGLKFGGTYWRIRMNDRVAVLPYDVLAANAERFPDRVRRAEPTAEDLSRGWPGRLTYLDLSRINFGAVWTNGIDWAASLRLPSASGEWYGSLSATWIGKYAEVIIPGTAVQNRLAIASTYGSVARWRGVASIGWNSAVAGLGTTVRYTAGYTDADSYGNLIDRRVASMTLVDVQGWIDIAELLGQRSTSLPNVKFTAGVLNLFDSEPSFSILGGANGYDTSQGDLKQRFGYARLSVGF